MALSEDKKNELTKEYQQRYGKTLHDLVLIMTELTQARDGVGVTFMVETITEIFKKTTEVIEMQQLKDSTIH